MTGWAPAALGGENVAERFTATLMDKVGHWAEFVEPSDLPPMVRQVVTAVLEGRDPVACRGPGRAGLRDRTPAQ